MAHLRATPSFMKFSNIGKQIFSKLEQASLQQGNVVDFFGEHNTGKSFLLQSMMVDCILPKSFNGCDLGVIYFDLDSHFDLLSIVSAIEQRTNASEEEIKKWLKNLYLIRCTSTEELAITLHSIEPLIANSKLPIGLIILDSISAFYWMDINKGGESKYLREIDFRRLVQVLETLKEKYKLCIFTSTQQLTNPKSKGENSELIYRTFLCRQWQNIVTHRFILTKQKPEDSINKQIFCVNCVIPKQHLTKFSIKNSVISYL